MPTIYCAVLIRHAGFIRFGKSEQVRNRREIHKARPGETGAFTGDMPTAVTAHAADTA